MPWLSSSSIFLVPLVPLAISLRLRILSISFAGAALLPFSCIQNVAFTSFQKKNQTLRGLKGLKQKGASDDWDHDISRACNVGVIAKDSPPGPCVDVASLLPHRFVDGCQLGSMPWEGHGDMGNSGFRWLGYVGIRVRDTTLAILQATFSALAMPVQYPGGKRGWVRILNTQHQQAFAFVRIPT